MPKEWPLDAERDLLSDACVPGRHPHSLWNFVRFAAGWHYRCTEPGQLNWLTERVHRPWLDWIDSQILEWKEMRRSSRPPERIQVIDCVPRGHGKSNAITKCVPLYAMLDEPNMTSYIGSETHPKAKAFLKPMKSILDGSDPYSLFTWFYGNWYTPDRDWNQEEIITAYRTSTGISEPSVGTFGVETGLTSKHPLLVIYDDPISEERLKESGNWLMTVLESLDAIYPALRPDSLFMLIGTRYRDDDPIGTSIATEGVKSWVGHDSVDPYPAGIWRVHFLQARDRYDAPSEHPKGRPLLPEAGWNEEALTRYEIRAPQKYAAQMMNSPSVNEQSEMTREQIEKLIIKREDLPPIEYATIHLDTAFKEDSRRERGDYNAIVVWLHDLRSTGIVYLDRILLSKQWRAEEFDDHLIRTLYNLRGRQIRVRAITDEKEVGGKRGVYRQHLEQVISGAGLRPPEILQLSRGGTKKVIRIREAANYWVDGFVRLLADAENLDIIITEMSRIGRTRHDDASDAAADVFYPTIWRGRQHPDDYDGQPPLPIQPGDDVLKGRLPDHELAQIERDLTAGANPWNKPEETSYERLMFDEKRLYEERYGRE